MLLGRDEVLAARAIIGSSVEHTPLLRSATLGVWLKCELFQHTGSFKARGALNRLSALTPDERARGVLTISAGNHARAVAWAARQTATDALVVMAAGASPGKIAATRALGATVDLEAATWVEAFERLVLA